MQIPAPKQLSGEAHVLFRQTLTAAFMHDSDAGTVHAPTCHLPYSHYPCRTVICGHRIPCLVMTEPLPPRYSQPVQTLPRTCSGRLPPDGFRVWRSYWQRRQTHATSTAIRTKRRYTILGQRLTHTKKNNNNAQGTCWPFNLSPICSTAHSVTLDSVSTGRSSKIFTSFTRTFIHYYYILFYADVHSIIAYKYHCR